MISGQKTEEFEQVVEKIVFDEEELEELKMTIKNFTDGKIQAIQLKQKLLQCRARMVEDISNFLSFCIDRMKIDQHSSDTTDNEQKAQILQSDVRLQTELNEKNELLKVVANKVNNLVANLKKD